MTILTTKLYNLGNQVIIRGQKWQVVSQDRANPLTVDGRVLYRTELKLKI